MNEPTEPTFNEQDIEDDSMNNLPTDSETMPLAREQEESYQSLKTFFNNARNF